LLLALSLLLLQNAAMANLLGGSEPLAPEVAFVPEVDRVDADYITVKFDIVDGYYLYRDKTSFSIKASDSITSLVTNSPGTSIQLGVPEFPEAIMLNDDFFGEMATYRKSVAIKIPYEADFGSTQGVLGVKFQGCADIGICYPPLTIELPLDLPASANTSEQRLAPLSTISSLLTDTAQSSLASPATKNIADANIFGDIQEQDELLPPELAYLPQISSASTQSIEVRWFIEPGYYLYKKKLSFELDGVDTASISHVTMDEGVDQYDEFFGNVKVFRNSLTATLLLASNQFDTNTTNANLLINYQGCADIGVCFPPSQTSLPLNFDTTVAENMASGGNTVSLNQQQSTAAVIGKSTNAAPGSAVANSNILNRTTETNTPAVTDKTIEQSEQDRLSTLLGTSSLWLTVATFFGFGILLAFTPCVLPMIPILSSMIVGQGDKMSTARAFQLSLVYVLVMATTYAIVGIIVGLSGYNVQAFLQNPWVLSFIAALFIILSLSMFGFYELQMPVKLQEKLTAWSNKQGGGQFTGVAAMGFISTLIVGPCITAPLAGALIYIANTGDAFIGGAALFALGLGMGAPLLLIGTSAGKLVPKAGMWMNTVKHLFGIIMLGMAIYMISRFIPSVATMTLFGILAVMSGIHFGATDTLNSSSSGWQRMAKGFGILVVLYGLALLIGSLSGNISYTTPLRGVGISGNSSVQNEQHDLTFAPVKSVAELDNIVAMASRENRPVMLDFYADWCISCKEMEAFTFTDTQVQRLLENAVLIQADVTANDALDKAMLKRFDLFGPPGIIFYGTDGQEIRPARVVGFMSADKFSAHIKRHI